MASEFSKIGFDEGCENWSFFLDGVDFWKWFFDLVLVEVLNWGFDLELVGWGKELLKLLLEDVLNCGFDIEGRDCWKIGLDFFEDNEGLGFLEFLKIGLDFVDLWGFLGFLVGRVGFFFFGSWGLDCWLWNISWFDLFMFLYFSLL